MVLDALIKIKNEMDPTLTFRRSCREGKGMARADQGRAGQHWCVREWTSVDNCLGFGGFI